MAQAGSNDEKKTGGQKSRWTFKVAVSQTKFFGNIFFFLYECTHFRPGYLVTLHPFPDFYLFHPTPEKVHQFFHGSFYFFHCSEQMKLKHEKEHQCIHFEKGRFPGPRKCNKLLLSIAIIGKRGRFWEFRQAKV